ncbi:MAG TPA: OmpA family protein [Saprospiraceae bacterium]|nr:OmpA family protein [Saprospiraceae bacterium]
MKHLLLCLCGMLIPLLSFTQTEISSQEDQPKTTDTTDLEIRSFLVFFPTGQSAIPAEYRGDLDKIAAQIIESQDSTGLLGYTDNVGDPDFNQRLSERRAASIKTYLVRQGVDPALLKVAFFGESQPLADNETVEGRSQNRRVEIKIAPETAAERDIAGVGDTTLYTEEKVEELLREIQLPENAKKVERPLPVLPGAGTGMAFESVEDTVISSNGATAMMTYRYQSGSARPRSVLFQIKGASSFYDIPVQVTATEGTISIPVSFSTKLGEGKIPIVAELMNANGQMSKIDTTYVKMERLGTGKIQISLSWENNSDQDLHVTTPGGTLIYYENPQAGGGQLDRDDQDGFGPENVFWLNDAPDGTYLIEVNDYLSAHPENPFVVSFNGMGTSKQFYGTTRNGSTEWVATFVKKGPILMWLSEDVYKE